MSKFKIIITILLLSIYLSFAAFAADLNIDVDSNDKVDTAYGGTNRDTSSDTGFAYITSGVWSAILKGTFNFTSALTITASDGTTTPDVPLAALGGGIYESDENGTITNFLDDSDSEDDFANGDWFIFLVTDASTTIDFSENSEIEGNAGVDFTGSATQITALLFIYENTRWNCINMVSGMNNPTSLALSALNMGGGILEIPNGDTITDFTNEGEFGYDSDGMIIVYDASETAIIGVPVYETIHATVVAPNDLADGTRDALPIWSNESGMIFTVTRIEAWSGTDDTELNVEEEDADGANNATVDALNIQTDGTGMYYTTETTITGATIEADHILLLDFDDTDEPTWVKISITGYFNGDVD